MEKASVLQKDLSGRERVEAVDGDVRRKGEDEARVGGRGGCESLQVCVERGGVHLEEGNEVQFDSQGVGAQKKLVAVAIVGVPRLVALGVGGCRGWLHFSRDERRCDAITLEACFHEPPRHRSDRLSIPVERGERAHTPPRHNDWKSSLYSRWSY